MKQKRNKIQIQGPPPTVARTRPEPVPKGREGRDRHHGRVLPRAGHQGDGLRHQLRAARRRGHLHPPYGRPFRIN